MQDRYSENNESLEEFFRKGFESHEVRPPDEVWDHIAAFLDAQEKGAHAQKSFLQQHWGKMLTGAALIGSVAIWYMITKNEGVDSVSPRQATDTTVNSSPAKSMQDQVAPVDEKKVEKPSHKKQNSVAHPKKDSVSSSTVETQEHRLAEPELPATAEPELPAEKEEKDVEEESGDLYDQIKKEKKGMKPLFIEKKR